MKAKLFMKEKHLLSNGNNIPKSFCKKKLHVRNSIMFPTRDRSQIFSCENRAELGTDRDLIK